MTRGSGSEWIQVNDMFATAARNAEPRRTRFPNIDRTLFRTAFPIRSARPFAVSRRSTLPAAGKPRRSAGYAISLSYMNQLGYNNLH